MSALVEKLRKRWLVEGTLKSVEDALAAIGFSDEYVDDLLAQPKSAASDKRKVIKDNIWGMVEVEPSCLRLLDSPLLQRLRGIHQLGLTYLTYPSAEHSRFIHSIGMFSVVSRFLDVMARNEAEQSRPDDPYTVWRPPAETVRILKHAAILHDCGHLPFSHVTELVYEADREFFKCGDRSVDDFEIPVHDVLGTTSKLAECISIAVVLTDRFNRFYTKWVQPGASVNEAKKIAALISGSTKIPDLRGISTIISGPSIDADKIDYINRDAVACGIPVGVDVARLFLRSSFLMVSGSEWKRLQDLDQVPSRGEVVFVVNASGLDSIEEIVQARTALYHRVYLHQTTRNAERLLGMTIHALASNQQRRRSRRGSPISFRDALQIWTLSDAHLMDSLLSQKVRRPKRLAARLHARQLPKRACIFSRAHLRMQFLIGEVLPKISNEDEKILRKEVLGVSLEELRADLLRGSLQRELENEITREAARLAKLLRIGGCSIAEQASGNAPSIVSVLAMPNLEPNRSDCIVLENRELTASSATSITDEQMEAADIAKSRGYVLTDDSWREIVFFASRTVLFRRSSPISDVRLAPNPGTDPVMVKATGCVLLEGDSVLRQVGLDRDCVAEVQQAAIDAGYFDSTPQLVSSELTDQTIGGIADKLRPFCGQGNWSVTRDSVSAYLTQFPPGLRRKMAELLEQVVIFDRTTLCTDIANGFAQIDLAGQGLVVGLSPDSGNIVRIQLEHELRAALSKRNWAFFKSIRDALEVAQTNDTLVFCDDNVTSGSQAICQFKSWLGEPKTTEELTERGIELAPLQPRERDTLRNLKIYIVTSAGTEEGKARLRSELTRLNLKFGELIYQSPLQGTSLQLDELEPFLEDVGKQVLGWARHCAAKFKDLPSRKKTECTRDALGYGGARALMCSPMNVPVGTLTAVWCPGLYKERPWIPLLLRRGYLEALVIA